MKKGIIVSLILLVFGGMGVVWYLRSAYKPLPRILTVGDQYNLGGERGKDDWGYRKPLQDLLGRGKHDFVGANSFPEGPSGYDPDTSAKFYQRIRDCKVNLGHSLDQLMGDAPSGSWIIIFIGTKAIMQPQISLENIARYFLEMVKKIHDFNPEIGVIVTRLPPVRVNKATKKYKSRILIFNRLLLEALQDLRYQGEKKNLFIPDLYDILTSVPGWKRKILGRGLYPTPLGWRIMAETFSDIIQGKKSIYYAYSTPKSHDIAAQKRLKNGFVNNHLRKIERDRKRRLAKKVRIKAGQRLLFLRQQREKKRLKEGYKDF